MKTRHALEVGWILTAWVCMASACNDGGTPQHLPGIGQAGAPTIHPVAPSEVPASTAGMPSGGSSAPLPLTSM